MPEHRDEDAILVARIHDDVWNLLSFAQSEVTPGLPGIGRFVDPVTAREVRSLHSFAAPDVNHIWIGWRNDNVTDRARSLRVEDWRPHASGVGCLPHPAIVDANVKDIRLAADSGGADRPAAAKRADHPPFETRVKRRVDGLGGRSNRNGAE
jgi:hypothetical protein